MELFKCNYYNFSTDLSISGMIGDQHSAKTAVCTNYTTVTVKIKIFMGQWVNPTDP
jgi:hypothetical protein